MDYCSNTKRVHRLRWGDNNANFYRGQSFRLRSHEWIFRWVPDVMPQQQPRLKLRTWIGCLVVARHVSVRQSPIRMLQRGNTPWFSIEIGELAMITLISTGKRLPKVIRVWATLRKRVFVFTIFFKPVPTALHQVTIKVPFSRRRPDFPVMFALITRDTNLHHYSWKFILSHRVGNWSKCIEQRECLSLTYDKLLTRMSNGWTRVLRSPLIIINQP